MQSLLFQSCSPVLLTVLCGLISATATADEQPETTPERLADKTTRTKHKVTIGGSEIGYTATAGRLVMENDEGEPQAEIAPAVAVRVCVPSQR